MPNCGYGNIKDRQVLEIQNWFAKHVTLFDQPYTLDYDQAQAVADQHQNTLVVARAGSGKTRVIVAKVAFLVAKCHLSISEIMIFMFNRTAAAEVNQRIAAVKIDNLSLTHDTPQIASTFHNFALDTVKSFGVHPQIIPEEKQQSLVSHSLDQALCSLGHKASSKQRDELLSIAGNFINRAGQKFPGTNGLKNLKSVINQYIIEHEKQPEFQQSIFWHQIALATYKNYLQGLLPPQTDFNNLMTCANELLEALPDKPQHFQVRYIMIDEYQDFSYLFFRLTAAIRRLTPDAHLFAVGDDWQAINRFAGSDINYFKNFSKYFPNNQITIPLTTNYRSRHKIVTTANQFMLANYDSTALPATPKNHKSGKVIYKNPAKTRFDMSDLYEDGLSDGCYLVALSQVNPHLQHQSRKQLLSAAKLLKTVTKIIRRHPRAEFMLLHRHNFTTCPGLDLITFEQALKHILNDSDILTEANFKKQIRCMTMHKSKGLEAEIVILLEMEPAVIRASHPHAAIFELFGDTLVAEHDDQSRLIYVALTRAKQKLYILTSKRDLITK